MDVDTFMVPEERKILLPVVNDAELMVIFYCNLSTNTRTPNLIVVLSAEVY